MQSGYFLKYPQGFKICQEFETFQNYFQLSKQLGSTKCLSWEICALSTMARNVYLNPHLDCNHLDGKEEPMLVLWK